MIKECKVAKNSALFYLISNFGYSCVVSRHAKKTENINCSVLFKISKHFLTALFNFLSRDSNRNPLPHCCHELSYLTLFFLMGAMLKNKGKNNHGSGLSSIINLNFYPNTQTIARTQELLSLLYCS